jgi:hypothetical protein
MVTTDIHTDEDVLENMKKEMEEQIREIKAK